MMTSSNLEELELLGSITFHLTITLLALCYVSVGLRLWARYRVTKSPGWDDVAMVATLLLFTTYCAFILAITLRSRDITFFTQKGIHTTLIFVQFSEVFYILTTTFLKVSLGLFFLRVLTKRWQKHVFHAVLGIGVFCGLFYFFIVLFQCGNPVHIADNLAAHEASQCLPAALRLTTGYTYGVVNVLADWTFVLIPITVLMDSDLDRRSKISVGMVMGLGAIGSVSSIMRLVYLRGLSLHTMSALNTESVKATIWATAEPGTGIIAASIAILRPLVRQVASEVRRQASYRSRARTMSKPDDTIALTGRESTAQTVDTKKMSMESLRGDVSSAPWSPAIVATADVQHMVAVKGRGNLTPEVRMV